MIPSKVPSTIPFVIPNSGDGVPCLPGCILYYDITKVAVYLEDLSGGGNNGKINTLSWADTGMGFFALAFDHVNAHNITCSLNYPRDVYSIEFWLSPTLSANNYILESLVGVRRLEIAATGDNYIVDGGFHNSGHLLPNGAWCHLVFAVNGTGAGIIYIDSVAHATTATESKTLAGPITIGSLSNGTNSFEGLMGIVRIYNRVISQAEVTSLFAGSRVKFGV